MEFYFHTWYEYEYEYEIFIAQISQGYIEGYVYGVEMYKLVNSE